MSGDKVQAEVARAWADDVLPSLSTLIEIPAVSPAYDADWDRNGHLQAAVEHVRDWIARMLPSSRCEVIRLPGRTPLLLVEVPATGGAGEQGTVLMYGHLDKQPPLGDWSEGLAPWQAVLREGRLYGRGAVDDGYAPYAATAALSAVAAAGGEHARVVMVLETGEESGSPDLDAYLEHLTGRLGDVTLVVCLDAGGEDYERLWLTDSLRGAVQVTLTVRVLDTAAHSGLAGGIVPSSFRIMRLLLDRVEDSATGEVTLPTMQVPIPERQRIEAAELARVQPGAAADRFPLVAGMRAAQADEVELILANTWRPALSVTGAGGLPDPSVAGAVLRAWTSLRLSFRTPPTVDPLAAAAELEQVLTTDVPYGAEVTVSDVMTIEGWQAPPPAPWLEAALERIGQDVFDAPCRRIGIGGGIPFMAQLSRLYPDAQFVATGALGSDSNLHVPDEWLNVAFAGRVTQAIAHILDAHAAR